MFPIALRFLINHQLLTVRHRKYKATNKGINKLENS